MNIVDTSGWLEFFAGTTSSKNFEKAIQDTNNLLVPTICTYEVFKKILIEVGEDEAIKAVGHMRIGKIIELDFELSVLAAKISKEKKLPMADSIIYACCQKYKATLFTQDNDFENLPNVKYYKKRQTNN